MKNLSNKKVYIFFLGMVVFLFGFLLKGHRNDNSFFSGIANADLPTPFENAGGGDGGGGGGGDSGGGAGDSGDGSGDSG